MADMPTEKTVIFFRVSRPVIGEALKKAAKKDLRSVSTLLEKIVEHWLIEHGHLPPTEEKTK